MTTKYGYEPEPTIPYYYYQATINMGFKKFLNLSTSSEPYEAATKEYVDDKDAGIKKVIDDSVDDIKNILDNVNAVNKIYVDKNHTLLL